MFLVTFVSHSGFESEDISRHRTEEAARKAAIKYLDQNPDRYGQIKILNSKADRWNLL